MHPRSTTRQRPLRRRALATVCAAALGIVIVSPAAQADRAVVPGSTQVSVALALRPASRSALAAAGLQTSDVRREAVARAAVPPLSAGAEAAAYLERHGFTVTAKSRWLLSATGRATAAQAAFGARLVRSRGYLHPTAPVGVPAQLRPFVTGVVGLDTRPRWRPRAVPRGFTGSDLQSAYQVGLQAARADGMTVATVQFSGWIKNDLATYAAAAGIAMPALLERPTGGVKPTETDGTGGEVEVALDHEALLASAPGAAHVIYFGRNTDVGAVTMYDAVATAAERGEFDVLSISWGQCEFEITKSALDAINLALGRIVAAGRTVFAASGDAGAIDCVSPDLASTEAVDFPASSPYVVGVGGTSLVRTSDGGWAETTWNQTTSAGSVGSGGGFSKVFPRPEWQPAVTAEDPAGDKMRMVPDIAAVADPRTGFGVFASSQGGWIVGGGTSLAAPVAAGQFASTLSALGKRNGLGRSLHPVIYANPQAFRDVVDGDNFAFFASAGYDRVTGLGSPLWDRLLPLLATGPIVTAPAATRSATITVSVSLPAGVAYPRYRICESNEDAHCDTPDLAVDPTTGPQTVQLPAGKSRHARIIVVGFDEAGIEHPGAAYTTYDVTAPVVSASARLTAATGTAARFSWGAVDPAPGSGIRQYEARITQAGVAKPVRTITGTHTSWTANLRAGGVYSLSVRATDAAGNVSAWKSADLVVPIDQTQLALRGAWSTSATRAAYGGSWTASSTAGATATINVRGSSADLMVRTGPTGGLVDVYVAGVLSARVDTYSPVVRTQRFLRVGTWPGPAPRAITVQVVGRHSPASRGDLVVIDGLRVNWR